MAGNIIVEKINAGALIVDVRTVDEFMDGAYPGAVNIPAGELRSRMKELEPKDRPLVLYCETGSRSALAAKQLKEAGWTDVLNAGGLEDLPDSD